MSVRYARANNKLFGSLYDPTQTTSYILYVDANNLYGWALSQPMPDNHIEWLSKDECRQAKRELQEHTSRDRFFAYHANSNVEYQRLRREVAMGGQRSLAAEPKLRSFEEKMRSNAQPLHFIFEVNMDYPPELHQRDDDYPMGRN